VIKNALRFSTVLLLLLKYARDPKRKYFSHVVQAREKLLASVSLLFWMFSTGGSRSGEEGLNGRV
jgi:hypothetical protein